MQKKAGVAILISDKIDFKMKTIFRDKEGHYIMIKGSIQEEITHLNIFEASILQYIRKHPTTLKREIDNNTISFKTAPQKIKYLGIHLTKEVKDLHAENYETLIK